MKRAVGESRRGQFLKASIKRRQAPFSQTPEGQRGRVDLMTSGTDDKVGSLFANTTSTLEMGSDESITPNCAPDTIVLDLKTARHPQRKTLLAPILYAMHSMAEDLRLRIDHYKDLCRLAPVICRIALVVRPEWADYWKHLCPDAMTGWPHPSTEDYQVDDQLPVWLPDVSAILYGRISNPEWPVPWHDAQHIANRFHLLPSFAFGRIDPLTTLSKLTAIYKLLALPDAEEPSSQKRAEKAIIRMVELRIGPEFLSRLPLGVLSPIREAMRTCQIAPPSDWTMDTYRAVGRNDIAASASHTPDMLFGDGYKTAKEFVIPSKARPTIDTIVTQCKVAAVGEVATVSGVELELRDFTDIRFGQDRRLDKVARLLCSSTIPSVKVVDRPELKSVNAFRTRPNKEQQHQVLRIAEQTLALPYGCAMFTYGSVLTVSKEAYIMPKMEFTIRLQPLNVTFHNRVAAGLRIFPSATGVESSWIAFNKPSELTPEHAGFLFGLGLTGHLKEMLTWHTFGYLTPKHDIDLTSIGVLLGLAAANVSSGEKHAAGLSGVGLLYMGTKNRRMAEPDLSNEYREAYTFSATLAFGMIMLGKGSNIPADMALLDRLTVLIHGEPNPMGAKKVNTFDRQDVTDILTIPDTVLALNHIQPSFLLNHVLAKALIMWDAVAPTAEWQASQIPLAIRDARMKTKKPVDDALELAYYNILAASCFVIGLKFAGTARQEAYI
ncbi:hypothetical protein C8F01DRAFT_1343574 [Mycena amicta]|nr:hypothetical protein C8F01DRAFT_1343574 [Mycena amicta]